MRTLTPIHVSGTPKPVGHYSQAIVANGFVFVSGQVPSDLNTGTPKVGTIEEQTASALENAERILKAAGSGLQHVVQMNIFISRIEDWPAVNSTYARIMGEARPSRAIVPVSPLHYGTAIEIQCVAVVPATRARAKKPVRRPARAPRRRGRR